MGLLRGWAMLGRSSPIGNCMRLMIWLAYGRLGSYGFVFEDVFDVWCELWDPPDEQSDHWNLGLSYVEWLAPIIVVVFQA